MKLIQQSNNRNTPEIKIKRIRASQQKPKYGVKYES